MLAIVSWTLFAEVDELFNEQMNDTRGEFIFKSIAKLALH
jgi:hypothetical protein